VLVTVSDKKLAVSANGTTIDYYNADVVTANDYYPFGSQMPGRKYSQPNSSYRYGFNGQEKSNEIANDDYDYGMRIYDTRLGRFLSVDPLTKNYPSTSGYSYAQNSPIYKMDIDGEWDITVHAYSDRKKYGYGIAIVSDKNGIEVFRFKVRLEGVGGRDRMVGNSDTPLGVYDIPNKNMWISGKSRTSYGPNARLALDGESGEIKKSGRSEIRIHGGRQETPIYKKGKIVGWEPISDAELKKTHGCLRAADADVKELKTKTDELSANDKTEFGGKLTIVADLELNKDGSPIEPPAVMAPVVPVVPTPSTPPAKDNRGVLRKLYDKVFGHLDFTKDFDPTLNLNPAAKKE
jgi:RHS repeat-associated protein